VFFPSDGHMPEHGSGPDGWQPPAATDAAEAG